MPGEAASVRRRVTRFAHSDPYQGAEAIPIGTPERGRQRSRSDPPFPGAARRGRHAEAEAADEDL